MRSSARRVSGWGALLALAVVLNADGARAQEVPTSPEPPPSPRPPVSQKPRPPLARLLLGGTTTWRKYCARPGVSSCGEFDAKPPEQQNGDTQSFSTSVPYLGFGLEAELLPLAHQDSLVRGLGVVLGARWGFSNTTVKISTPSGETPDTKVSATDTSLTALAMYRYYFERSHGETPLLGYVGVRGGVMGRAFAVDESALRGTHRLAPVVGLEVSVPLLRPLRVEGAGHLFIQPKPGHWVNDTSDLDLEVRDFGESVSSTGWSAELGLAGDVWGPLGYSVRFNLTHFKDTFSGAGARTGWSAGGVAEETYSTVTWNLTASW